MKTRVYIVVDETEDCIPFHTATGTATSANPDRSLTLTQEWSQGATSSNTLGIDDEIVCTATVGVSVGWKVQVTDTVNFNWDAGTPYTCSIGFNYETISGDVFEMHRSNPSCFVACDEIVHVHQGTFSSTKYTAVCTEQDPAS